MRHGPLPLLFLLVFAAVVGAEDGEPRAFVEVTTPRSVYWQHETIELSVRVSVEREFFEKSVISLFRREMDVDIQVDAPWLRALPDAARPGGETRSFVLGDEVVRARRLPDEERGGRIFEVLEVRRRLRPDETGTIELSGPTLRYAYATRFEEDFLGGRVPVDRHHEMLKGMPLTLEVRPLPEAGRPEAFVDAVGRFEMRARLLPPKTPDAAPLRLRLEIAGEGNLDTLTPPSRQALAGFHVYGVKDEREAGRRVLTYELAALAEDVSAVPAVALAYFDPGESLYRVARTEAIVLPGREAALPPGAPPTRPTATPASATGALVLRVAAFLALALVLWLGWGLLRQREPDAPEPSGPAPDARQALAAALASEDADPAQAFAAFLAAHLDCRPAAVISPDLPRRLIGAGLSVELATEAAETLEHLVASRYGALGTPPDEASLEALAEKLEAGLQSSP